MQGSPVYCSYKYVVSRFRSMAALASKADLNSIHGALLPALWWSSYYMKRAVVISVHKEMPMNTIVSVE